MLASLTLLPALLGFFGTKVLSRRQRARLRAAGPADDDSTGLWHRWATAIEHRPVLPAVLALAAVIVIALPVFSLRLGLDDAGSDPPGTTTRQTYTLLADRVVSAQLIVFIAVVVALGFVLLMAVFRSLLIPLTASVMNLLAVAAALGLMNAIFAWGWGHALFGISATAPVEVFVPVLLISILFGLSMDYEVFLVSRMREEWARTGDNHLALTRGDAATAGLNGAGITPLTDPGGSP